MQQLCNYSSSDSEDDVSNQKKANYKDNSRLESNQQVRGNEIDKEVHFHIQKSETEKLECLQESEETKNISNTKTVAFFNLGDTSSEDEEETVEPNTQRVLLAHGVQNVEVELPTSSFWKDCDSQNSIQRKASHAPEYLATEDLIADCAIKNSDGNFKSEDSPKVENCTKFTGLQINKRKSSSLWKLEPSSKTTSLNFDIIIPNKHLKSENPSKLKGNYLSTKNEKTDDSKVYYIHHRIQPTLYRQCPKFRVPRNKLFSDNHAGTVNRVQWCIPQYSHLFLSASMDRAVKIWNAFSSSSTKCVRTMQFHEKAVKDAVWNHKGTEILSCSYDRTVILQDVETGQMIHRYPHHSFVTAVKYHPVQPDTFLSGTSKGEIQYWDRRREEPVKSYSYKDTIGQVQDLIFLLDGSTFFSCSDQVSRDSSDRNIMSWDFKSGVVLSNQMYQERFTCTRLKLLNTNLLAQSQGNYIALFSTQKPFKMNRSKRFEGHKLLGYSIGFDISPDGAVVASGSSDGKAYFYDYHSSRCIKKLDLGMDVCMDISLHPVLPSVTAVCSWDGQIAVWN